MARLALYTFGLLQNAYTSEASQDFRDASPLIFTERAVADGFIAHAGASRPDLRGGAQVGQDFGPWGTYAAPRFFAENLKTIDVSMIQTLSLWRDREAARKFSYSGLHRAALKRRADWFQSAEWPGYVLWWVPDTMVPSWSEGVQRLETIADRGATATAFDFVRSFDESGRSDVST